MNMHRMKGGNRMKDQTNFVRERDDYDCRPIEYYRDMMDASYATSSAAYTGGQNSFPAGDLNWFPDKLQEWLVTGVKEYPRSGNVVEDFSLTQNYPNPFNPSTNIEFAQPEAGHVTITIYNTIGQRIGTLVDKKMEQGIHRVTFDASNLTSGVYFYRISAGSYTEVKKMMFLK